MPAYNEKTGPWFDMASNRVRSYLSSPIDKKAMTSQTKTIPVEDRYYIYLCKVAAGRIEDTERSEFELSADRRRFIESAFADRTPWDLTSVPEEDIPAELRLEKVHGSGYIDRPRLVARGLANEYSGLDLMQRFYREAMGKVEALRSISPAITEFSPAGAWFAVITLLRYLGISPPEVLSLIDSAVVTTGDHELDLGYAGAAIAIEAELYRAAWLRDTEADLSPAFAAKVESLVPAELFLVATQVLGLPSSPREIDQITPERWARVLEKAAQSISSEGAS